VFFFDDTRGQLIVGRDKLGLTPVVISRGDDHFAASTDPEILRDCLSLNERVNRERLATYLLSTSRGGRDDFVSPIERLLPGEFAIVSGSRRVEIRRHFSRLGDDKDWRGFREEARRLRDWIEKLVKDYRPDDVAYMMSGGLDSTALIGAHSRMFDDASLSAMSLVAGESRYEDESDLISVMRSQFPIDYAELELTSRLPLTDERVLGRTGGLGPQWHPGTAYETQLLESIATRFGVRRILGGVGGDHLFAGRFGDTAAWHLRNRNHAALIGEFQARWTGSQLWYRLGRWLGGRLLSESAKSKIRNIVSPAEATPAWLKPRSWTTFHPESAETVELFEADAKGIPREQTWRWEVFVRECRRKERISETHYVFPYLDSEFVERFSGLPPSYRYRRGVNKAILREAVSGVLPEPILRADKRLWIGNLIDAAIYRHRHDIEELFSSPYLADLGLIEPATFLKAFRIFIDNVSPEGQELGMGAIWRTISAEIWLTNFYE
jgi:asparagine synthase (glutamine-hydrolysing)